MIEQPTMFHRQRGAALFVSLMLLLILTVLGLSSSNVSIMQERMASNVTDYNLAFQEAEETLREIEGRVTDIMLNGTSGGLGTIPTASDWGLPPFDCTATSPGSVANPGDWDTWAAGRWLTAPDTGNDYFVLEMREYNLAGGLLAASACRPVSEAGADVYYMIAARGVGPGGAEAVVQSIFFLPF